ncbi:MAG: glycosyltransferase [Dinoroseobacter sp.]|nr:glycosyltransferase [Dinoroseobacter sp.]
MSTHRTIILQRTIAHYRVPVFEKLYERYGWIVVTSSGPPADYLSTFDSDAPWLKRFPFKFRDPNNAHACTIPVGDILRDLKPKSVITEFSLNMNSTYDLLMRRRFGGGPKLVFWTHGYNASRTFIGPKDIALQYLAKALLSRADACVCYSAEGIEHLSSWMRRDRLFRARNTQDISEPMRLYETLRTKATNDGKTMLTVGRLTKTKRMDLLVEAYRAALHEMPRLKLKIIGDGPERSSLEAAAADLPGVTFLGQIYEEAELAKHFLSADLFIYAGKVGLAANHALAYGLPVMIFEPPKRGPFHAPEHIYVVDGQTGIRVNPPTKASMTEAICRYFSRDNPRAHFEPMILDYVRENIVLDRMIEDFAALHDFLR